MQPELSGGLPPLGQDVNGFLYLLSSHIFFLQSGTNYGYNSDVSTAMSGYAAGASLAMADNTGLWINQTAGNTTNPDAGGAGWAPLITYGVSNITGLTGGTVNLTAAQTKYFVINLSGTLTSNLILNLPPNFQSWLIVNNTTGAFTVTVQTAAGGSSGVIVPQGGPTSPTGVYSIGDGNIYNSVAPLSVPISQAATGLTLAERTSAGYLLATYFNQSSAIESPAVGSVFVQNTAADGYLRKISNANFITALGLATLANPTFTGVPKAPTAAANTNTTQVATTAFVQTAVSAQTVKCGVVVLNNGANSVTFPVAFPTSCSGVVLTPYGAGATYYITAYSRSGFSANVGVTQDYFYVAVGS